ncbi:MAG: DUF559 domain-containing protein [Hyphomicrobiaceae bacterium]
MRNLDRAKHLRRQSTEAERRLWERLRGRRLEGLKFRRQVPIGRYIADFVCHDAKLIVEVDGSQHDDVVAADAERTRALEAAGYLVVRCWNNDVMAQIEAVVAMIADTAIAARRGDSGD